MSQKRTNDILCIKYFDFYFLVEKTDWKNWLTENSILDEKFALSNVQDVPDTIDYEEIKKWNVIELFLISSIKNCNCIDVQQAGEMKSLEKIIYCKVRRKKNPLDIKTKEILKIRRPRVIILERIVSIS
ncbi:MAG: hypothetical protein KKA07_18785 [Bacteroidetes bacterium]|nr:hypothetical protein [Bacteroidota bacterium]MBU1721119.1 hypothetical protein [Bacteroidota bacterium]